MVKQDSNFLPKAKSLIPKVTLNNRVQISNFLVAKGVSDAIRTSLGPHGMDKIIILDKEILITNDGATIMKNSNLEHPIAKLLVSLSESQDSEVGDGTTSVIVLSGSIFRPLRALHSLCKMFIY